MGASALGKFCKAKSNWRVAATASLGLALGMERKGNANLNQRKREIEMKTLSAILIGLMACVAIGVSTARGQMYSLEDMGVVKGMEASDAAAINNQGYVAGTAYKGEQTCAFHYDYFKKFMEDAGGLNSRGFGINSANIVVGDFFPVGPMEPRSHAAIFKSGVPVDLGVLKGQLYSRANGINATGQVVGFSGPKRDSNESRAFMWSGQTGMIDIGTLGGAYAQASAINDAGYITGASQTQGMGPMVTTHAFTYRLPYPPYRRYDRMVDLGVLGGNSSYGMAINDYNHVVGYSTLKTNDERVHGFLYDGKSMINLGSLGGDGNRWGSDFSVALGVNNLDQVVGYTYLPAVGEMPIQQVAFLWYQTKGDVGKMVNLNNLLDKTGKNYLVFSATAINDNGQIAASAYDMGSGTVRAVLLTPLR
jgi:probable HAF family extracellular repeat protein